MFKKFIMAAEKCLYAYDYVDLKDREYVKKHAKVCFKNSLFLDFLFCINNNNFGGKTN